MGGLTKFRVILSGKLIPEFDRSQVLEGLAKLFNSRVETMEKLLQGRDVPLKKEYSEEQAEIICENIRVAGAQCRIEEIPKTGPTTIEDTPSEELDSGEFPGTDADDRNEENSTNHVRADGSVNPQKNFNTALMRFVNSNVDYYRHQFAKFGDPRNPVFKITWHWSAFFFFFWALYRKLWLWAAVHMIGGMALMMWIPPGLAYLVWILIWPVVANYLYFRKAVAVVSFAESNPEYERNLLGSGGVSRGAVWGGIAVTLISTMLVSSFVTSRFLDRYGDQMKDVLPGSGTQTRGDGLQLGDVSGKDPQFARTSFVLSGLATSLKILLVTDDAQQNQRAISKFLEKISEGDIRDGWGSKIAVEQELDRYVLISSGPDKVYKTDDDILQPVDIR